MQNFLEGVLNGQGFPIPFWFSGILSVIFLNTLQISGKCHNCVQMLERFITEQIIRRIYFMYIPHLLFSRTFGFDRTS